MRRDDVFPSKYLKAADLNGKPIVVTIEHAPLETLKSPDGKESKKIVLYFRGAKKALPLNITNWDAVAEICGDDSDEWLGKAVELYPARTQMGGKTIDCIRIRAPQQAGASKQKPAPESFDTAGDFGDDLTF